MTIEIRHTKKQAKIYHKEITDLVLFPLQTIIIDKLAKAIENQSVWKREINKAFFDNDYKKTVENKSNSLATKTIDVTASWQLKKMTTQFQELFGIDILPILAEKNINAELTPIIEENIDLIKSIPQKLHSQVLTDFDEIINKEGFNTNSIFNMLTKRFGVANSRAKLIANDQVSKTIGNLAGIRQAQMGIKKFIWKTAEDEKVRPAHQVLDNQIFNWNNPPPIGIPGQPINCRCVAIPFISETNNNL